MSSTHSYPAPASVFFLYYYDHNVWLSTGSDVFFIFLFLLFLLLLLTHFLLFSSPTLFLPFSYLYLLLLFFCFVFIVPPPSSPFALNLSPYPFPPPLCSCLIFWFFFFCLHLSFHSVVFLFTLFVFHVRSSHICHSFQWASSSFSCSFSLLPFSFVSLLCHTIGSPHLLSLLTLSHPLLLNSLLLCPSYPLFYSPCHFSAPSPQPCREEERLLIGPMDQEDGTMNELPMPFFPPQIPSTGYLWVLQFNYNSEYLRLFFCKFKQLHTVTLPLAALVNVFFIYICSIFICLRCPLIINLYLKYFLLLLPFFFLQKCNF